MPKFVFAVFAACLLLAPIHPQKKSDLEKSPLRGKIQRIETFRMSFDAAKGWSNRQPWLAENYNADGNTAERTVYQDGKLSSKVVFFYDARGRKIGDDSYSAGLDPTMTVPSKTELILDAAGNTVELKVYARNSPDIVDVSHKFKYDARGNQIERDYGRSGKSVITFDDGNNETSVINYNVEGVIYGKALTEYDEQNRRVKLTLYRDGLFYKDARLRYEISYGYDERGRVVQQITRRFNAEPNVIASHSPEAGKIVFKYDDANRAKEKSTYTADGYLREKSITIADERGNEIGFDCRGFELESCRSILEYQYDDQRNWISKTYQSRDGAGMALKSYFREERIITYY